MATIAKRRNRWVVDFYDLQGKRRWKTMPKGTTKGKAKDALRDIEDQLKKGIYLPDKKIPTFKKVAEDWLEYKKLNLRASTHSVYEGHTKNHFGDITHLPINRITVAHVEKYITKRQTEGMSIGLIKKVLVSFGQIMAFAVKHRYIDHNPVRDAERPKGQGKETEQTIKVLSPEQISTLLDKVPTQKYRTIIMLAIMTGARQGEILGLKWSDINWDSNQIHIQRTFNNGRWYDVKTASSNRLVDIGPQMVMELKRWRLACPVSALDLVFPNRAGKPINHNNLVSRYFHPALEKAEIDRIRWHDLRHTKASLMIEQKENLKYIQTQLGHSSPTVTLNVYAHLLNPINQEAACRYENLIFQTNGSKMVAEIKKEATALTVTP
jgi:integrase